MGATAGAGARDGGIGGGCGGRGGVADLTSGKAGGRLGAGGADDRAIDGGREESDISCASVGSSPRTGAVAVLALPCHLTKR